MHVSEALATRRTYRAFLPTPVAPEIVRTILEDARHTPSGGNLQPWWVWALAGEPLEALRSRVRAKVADGTWADGAPEYTIFPETPKEPYATRRFENGEAVFGAIGVSREDWEGRMRQTARNFEFFGRRWPCSSPSTVTWNMGSGPISGCSCSR